MGLYLQMAHRIYLKGYGGYRFPRWMRRAFARTELHRAWLAGYMGIFWDMDGVLRGGLGLDQFSYRLLR